MAVDLTGLVFYYSAARGNFSETAEPTLEGTTATDSINRSVSSGGQVPDIFDGNRKGILTLEATGLVTGNNSTFAGAGDWDTSDANVSIGGGVMDYNVVAIGDGGELAVEISANVSYFLNYLLAGMEF